IVKISGKFATWGKGLGGSNQVSKFMDYVRTNGPKIWETVQNIAKAAVHLVTALSGSGGDTLSGIVGISKALAGLSPGQIQALAAAFVTFKAAQAGVEGAKSLGAIPDQIKEAKDQITGFASGAKSAWNAVSSGATKSAQMLGRVRDGFRSTQAAESAFSGRAGSLGGVLRKSLNAAGSGWGKLVDGAKGAGTAVAGASTKILAAGKAAASAALDLGKMAAGYVLTGLKAAWSAIQLVAVKVAQLAVKAATAAWAAIQWVLDAALSANPIGLVVIAIVALVAAVVYAYTHFTWFKNAVDAAWKGIVAVFMWAWDTVIKPIFNIYKWYILNIMVPYFKLLWATAKLIWAGIAEVIHLYWTYYIKPVFNLIKWFIINVVIAYFKMLWSAAKTIWNGISSAISFVWNNGIKPVFNAIKSAVGVVQTAFRTAVDGIRRIWDGLKGIARTPVNFVIGIFNAGIVNLVNRIASFAGIKAHLNAIPKLAAGGTLDNPARVGPMKTRGPMAIVGEGRRQYPEYVIPTDPKFRGRAQGLWAAAGRDLSGGGRGRKWLSGPDALGGEGMGFAHGGTIPQLAGGGIIGGFIKGLKNFAFGNVEKAAKAVLDQVTGGSIPGSGMFRDAIAAVPGWIKDKVLGWVKAKVGMGAGGPGMAGALNWAKSQSGKPYSWGGVGPAGYDCSGFMSAITNVIHGKSPYSRMFSTHSFGSTGGPGGFVRNQRSGFMVGVTNAGVGHMAGTLLGTNVESNGSQGVHYGPGARGFNDPLFGYQYGLKADTGALTLRPGWNPPTYNGTGKPELLTAAPPTAAPIVLEITPSGSRGLDALFLEWLRNAIRIKGGDVQTVLGQ
ncbi:MAG: Phage-related protein, partial [Actinomycetia bacterium]|nr:Phage-related protein [Actinomycetes bacterium]